MFMTKETLRTRIAEVSQPALTADEVVKRFDAVFTRVVDDSVSARLKGLSSDLRELNRLIIKQQTALGRTATASAREAAFYDSLRTFFEKHPNSLLSTYYNVNQGRTDFAQFSASEEGKYSLNVSAGPVTKWLEHSLNGAGAHIRDAMVESIAGNVSVSIPLYGAELILGGLFSENLSKALRGKLPIEITFDSRFGTPTMVVAGRGKIKEEVTPPSHMEAIPSRMASAVVPTLTSEQMRGRDLRKTAASKRAEQGFDNAVEGAVRVEMSDIRKNLGDCRRQILADQKTLPPDATEKDRREAVMRSLGAYAAANPESSLARYMKRTNDLGFATVSANGNAVSFREDAIAYSVRAPYRQIRDETIGKMAGAYVGEGVQALSLSNMDESQARRFSSQLNRSMGKLVEVTLTVSDRRIELAFARA